MNIAIVNDLPSAVEALRRALALRPGYRLLWVASDGIEAVERCAREPPDLVLMDLVMPRMDGVEATRRIMASTPCAILIVTVDVGAQSTRVFEAMGHGALDAVDTPQLGLGDGRAGAAPLLAKIDLLGKLIADRGHPERNGLVVPPPGELLLAIGASAGGPAALAHILAVLPPDLDAATVVVQHVDRQFAPGMAQWLNQGSRLPVRVAAENDAPQRGVVLLAATNDHLVLKSAQRLGYTREPLSNVYRPSVDVFFQSVCRLWRGPAIGVLLTGMGRDGALGLKALRNRGCHTIAQDEGSSAVYGMPKAAVKLQAAVEVLPLERIASRLAALCAAASAPP